MSAPPNSVASIENCGIVPTANTRPSLQEMERMARRRYQNPEPRREGNWWYVRLWQDGFRNGQPVRKYVRIKLAPASMAARQVRKLADEYIRPINQGIVTVGCAISFADYVTNYYTKTDLPLRAKTVQNCYAGIIEKYLNPAFGNRALGEITPITMQAYFTGLPDAGIPFPTISKIRDAVSSVMRSAVKYKYLTTNPMEGLELPPDKRGQREKPFIYPHQFEALLELMPEPYASMVFVAVWTGLRVSELCGLLWRNIHNDSITIERRFCRGDWSKTKTDASAATISVPSSVIARIHRLKTLTVDVRAGLAVRHYKAVKADGPDDLVFQSVKDGKPMNDHNILSRFIKPAARQLGLSAVNWRCLRTSCATWMVQAGADPKSVQGQMRHARITTTLEIYAQCVPEGQRRAVEQMEEYAKQSVLKAGAKSGSVLVQ